MDKEREQMIRWDPEGVTIYVSLVAFFHNFGRLTG